MDLAQRLVPDEVELRVFLLQLAQLRQQGARVAPLRQRDTVGHHRLEHRLRRRALRADALPRIRRGKPLHGADAAGRDLVRRVELRAGVQPDGADLLRDGLVPVFGKIRERCAHLQAAAGDLHAGEAAALRVAHDLVDLRAELRRILRLRREALERGKKGVHPVELQPGAEKARKQLPPPDEAAQLRVRDAAALQIALEHALVAERGVFPHVRLRRGEVHARGVELPLQRFQPRRAVRAGQVHFRHEQKRRDAVAPQKLPERFRVRLHAVRAADDEHRRVQHLQRALHLGGEVHVPRRVQQRDHPVAERKARLLGKDRDAALPLQRVRVEMRVLIIDPPQRADRAGAVKQRLGQRGLPRVHVRQNAQYQLLHSFLVLCFRFRISIPETATRHGDGFLSIEI